MRLSQYLVKLSQYSVGLSSIRCVPVFGETDFVFGETVPVFGETVLVSGETVPCSINQKGSILCLAISVFTIPRCDTRHTGLIGLK